MSFRIVITWRAVWLIVLAAPSCALDILAYDEDGAVVRESLTGNTTGNFTLLQYATVDGTVVWHKADFKHAVQVYVVSIRGELELLQPRHVSVCMALPLNTDQFIQPAAVAKLRQKHRAHIRRVDDVLSTSVHRLRRWRPLSAGGAGLWKLSRQQRVAVLAACRSHGRHATLSVWMPVIMAEDYAEQSSDEYDDENSPNDDQYTVDKTPAHNERHLLASDTNTTSLTDRQMALSPELCSGAPTATTPCTCVVRACLPWYPCALRYCSSSATLSDAAGYKCGVRTCSQCRRFMFVVAAARQHCFWRLNA